MNSLALVTDAVSLPNDYDMPLLLAACQRCGLTTTVCEWDDPAVDWSLYDAVVLRSSWDYTERLSDFIAWCEGVAAVTNLFNPLSVVRWSLDKHYLADLAARGVPVVPSSFVEPGAKSLSALQKFLADDPLTDEFVVKPAVGCYSKNVQRYTRVRELDATEHIDRLLKDGSSVILQPYLRTVDRDGETNLIYFDGQYSHAIRKGALLMEDGTVNSPTTEFRSARVADQDERTVALAALNAVRAIFDLERPLLYARVDLIRGNAGKPQLLELEICEPSISLPFAQGSAMRFAQVIAKLIELKKISDLAVSKASMSMNLDV